jgi:hypothetical protein
VQVLGEPLLEQVAEEEDRHRHTDERADDGAVVQQPPVEPGGHIAQGYPQPDGDDQGRHRQLDGGRERPADDVGDRVAAADRVAEVADQDPFDEPAVLHPQRLVIAEGLRQQRPPLGRGPLAEQRLDRAAGQAAQPEEDERRQGDQRDDHLQQPADDDPYHPTPFLRPGAGTLAPVDGTRVPASRLCG